MLNLSSMSNTDLKLEYGVANLDELSACDDRFSTFERNAAIYAQELSDAGYTDQARQLLEFAVSCHVDNSSIYTQLAAIYQTGGNLSGILQLQEAAAQLAPFPQKIILEKLKKFPALILSCSREASLRVRVSQLILSFLPYCSKSSLSRSF